MKIAYIITRMDQYGGAQIHVRDLAMYARNQGHEVHVISGMPGKVLEFLQYDGIPCHEIPALQRAIHPWRDLKATIQLRQGLKGMAPDIVSCHSSKAGVCGRFAALGLGIPVIHTAHGWAFTDGVPALTARFYRLVERCAAPLASHIVTVCEHDRKLALKARIARPEKMTTIHNGMPWADVPDKPAGGHRTGVRLIMVARFAPQKDHATLIKALAGLKDLDWQLDLIGGGDETAIRQRVESESLQERVYFRGEREDVPDWMAASDIVCLITHYEGFPRSILEAMRAARPVVASDVAGVGEAVVDGETGRLVPRRDVTYLQRCLRELIADKALQEKLGRQGRRCYEKHFTLAHMADKTFDLYHKLVEESGEQVCG
jgi:glycosyltransferase involved in cell wall biosynthesis